jgi:hypothetical protein
MKKKRRPKMEEPEEIQPATIIEEIPVLLIDIRELMIQTQSAVFDPGTPGINDAKEMFERMIMIVDSCIQVIKAEGLKQMGLDAKDCALIAFGLGMYAGEARKDGHPLSEAEHLRVGHIMQAINILHDAGYEPELTATVNKLPGSEENQSGVIPEG